MNTFHVFGVCGDNPDNEKGVYIFHSKSGQTCLPTRMYK